MSPKKPGHLPILTQLRVNRDQLTSGQKRIVDIIIADPLHGALWGIEALSRKADVSVATVVRLSIQFGYKGFKDFRLALQEAASVKATVKEQPFLEAPPDTYGTLAEVLRRDEGNLQRLLDSVNEAQLADATRQIVQARHRLLLGRGVSHVMAEMLAYQLTQAGFPCIPPGPADFSTQVANLGPQDLVMAFSFSPYSRETVDAAKFARESGIPVLAFSDTPASPLSKLGQHTLIVPCENLLYSHSLTTFAVLSHALATAAASRDREGTLRRLRAAEKVSQPTFFVDSND